MKRLKDEIREKSDQIYLLEKHMSNYFVSSDKADQSGVSQVCSLNIVALLFEVQVQPNNNCCFVRQTVAELIAQLNEKSFELEVIIIYSVLMLFSLWNIWDLAFY